MSIYNERSEFSLHTQRRSLESILTGFQEVTATYFLRIINRIRVIEWNTGISAPHHLPLTQSLMTMQAETIQAPRLLDLVSTRRYQGEKARCVIASTILGALATIEIIKLVLSKQIGASMPLHNYQLCLQSLSGANAAYMLKRTEPATPLQMNSIALEATRGVPLRCIPDRFTAWTQISLPRGSEMCILRTFIDYMEVSRLCFEMKNHAHYFGVSTGEKFAGGSCSDAFQSASDSIGRIKSARVQLICQVSW